MCTPNTSFNCIQHSAASAINCSACYTSIKFTWDIFHVMLTRNRRIVHCVTGMITFILFRKYLIARFFFWVYLKVTEFDHRQNVCAMSYNARVTQSTARVTFIESKLLVHVCRTTHSFFDLSLER